jgi:uncharacterized protein (DUF111 family)
MIGEEKAGEIREPHSLNEVTVIETNIDDMTPQNFAFVTERLLEAGALDVTTVPVQMKKGRSGFVLQVLSPMNRSEILSRLIFEETTSIGLRQYVAKRVSLERELVPIETQYGTVTMKVSRQDGKVVSSTPEYEDCARIARASNVPLKEIQALAAEAYRAQKNE